MSGSAFALFSAVCFAASQIFLRRGVFRAGESSTAVTISVFLGTLLFTILLLGSGEGGRLWALSWWVYVLLGVAGIIHFVVGRWLLYTCIRLIGSNRAGPLMRTSLLFAITIAVVFLDESLTLFIILGILCIAVGATLIGLSGAPGKGGISRGTLSKGILAGLGTGFFFGVSPVLVRAAVQEVGSPIVAAFISYIAAFLIIAGSLLRKGHRHQLGQLDRFSLVPLVLNGILVSTAQLFRYIALDLTLVSIVTPLIGTSGIFVILLSFLINRKLETFNWKILLGGVIAVAGAFLIFRT